MTKVQRTWPQDSFARVPHPSFAFFAKEDGNFDLPSTTKNPAQAKLGRGTLEDSNSH